MTPPLEALKRGPLLGISRWHERILTPGKELPPHIHMGEDEVFFVLDGQVDVYVGTEAFTVEEEECVFLPRLKPHAFIIRSPLVRVLVPAEIKDAFRDRVHTRRLSLRARALPRPAAELEEPVRRFPERGIRILTPDEIAEQMPLYPVRQ